MRFKFSLSTLLKAKEIKLKQIQKELSTILQEQTKLKEKLLELEKEEKEAYQDFKELRMKNKIFPEDITYFHTYFETIKQEIKSIKQKIEQNKFAEQKKREKLLEISKEIKGLEKLKSKELLQFNETIKELEAEELDEVSIRNFRNRTA
jgi:flagellar export protein FliJ